MIIYSYTFLIIISTFIMSTIIKYETANYQNNHESWIERSWEAQSTSRIVLLGMTDAFTYSNNYKESDSKSLN